MEIHKNIKENKYNISLKDNVLDYFKKALLFCEENYREDMQRISTTSFKNLTPEVFFREYIWVVYTSGFNAKIVSKHFPALQDIYSPLLKTLKNNDTTVNSIDIGIAALGIINNKRKVKSVISFAFDAGKEIARIGWEEYKNTKLNSPENLQTLPFIGSITRFHLARNIGHLDFVKPDKHLERAAAHYRFATPLEMCEEIKKHFDMKLGLIDLVLWYSLSTFGSK